MDEPILLGNLILFWSYNTELLLICPPKNVYNSHGGITSLSPFLFLWDVKNV